MQKINEIKGTNQRSKEYIIIRNEKGYRVLEHRDVWEKSNGKIPEGNIIHHKNGNKKDNSIENLECLNIKEHGKKHAQMN